jgi:hypothetical protein
MLEGAGKICTLYPARPLPEPTATSRSQMFTKFRRSMVWNTDPTFTFKEYDACFLPQRDVFKKLILRRLQNRKVGGTLMSSETSACGILIHSYIICRT